MKDFLKIKTDISSFHGQLSPAKAKLIEQYGAWYLALASKKIHPKTAAQEHFIAVHQGLAYPDTDHEEAWLEYRKILIDFKKAEDEKKPPVSFDLINGDKFRSMKTNQDAMGD